MFKMIYNIARAELSMLFYSPVAWLILVVFSIQAGINFSDNINEMVQSAQMGRSFAGTTYAVFSSPMRGLLHMMEKYLYYYIPLLTMGLVSKELSSGSIKLLYSSPLTNAQIILGKFFSMMLYGLCMVAILLLIILCGGGVLYNMDWSLVFVGLLGFYLLLCAYAAIGVFMSSLTSYQIVAAIGTFAVLMILSLVGHWWQQYDIIRDVTYWLSISGRSTTFNNGLICSEDVLYFILVISLFLSLTIIRLNAVRQKIRFYVTFSKNIGVILFICLLGYVTSQPYFKFYHDATDTEVNTLTKNSQKIVNKLDGDLKITTYINALEPDAAWFTKHYFLKPDMERFDQYLRFKPDMKLEYVYYYDNTENPRLEKKFPNMTPRQRMIEVCKMLNLDSTRFISPEELHKEVDLSEEGNTFVRQITAANGKKSWLRIYDDMTRFPDEREISAALKRVAMDLPRVGFVEGQGERSIVGNKDKDYTFFTNNRKARFALVNQGFEIERLNLSSPVPENINILVIGDMRESFTEIEERNLQQYIDRGGNMFVLGEPKHRNAVNPLFAQFGYHMPEGVLVRPDTNLLADIVMSYPTKEAAGIDNDFRIMDIHKNVVSTPSCGSLEKVEDKGFKETILFTSDPNDFAWNELETEDFEEETPLCNMDKGEIKKVYPTVIALEREQGNRTQKIVLSADADCVSNIEFSRRANYNLNNYFMITGVFSWMSDHEVPIDVSRPSARDRGISIGVVGGQVIKWSFSTILPLLLALAGIFIWIRRKGR